MKYLKIPSKTMLGEDSCTSSYDGDSLYNLISRDRIVFHPLQLHICIKNADCVANFRILNSGCKDSDYHLEKINKYSSTRLYDLLCDLGQKKVYFLFGKINLNLEP